MEVGIPGEGPELPRSSNSPVVLGPPELPRPRRGAGHAAKWMLAAVGAGFAYLLAQIVALVALNLALPSADIDGLAFVATAASLVLAALWWLRLGPRARLRREMARPSRPAYPGVGRGSRRGVPVLRIIDIVVRRHCQP